MSVKKEHAEWAAKIRKHKPISEKWMIRNVPEGTICQILRDIYFLSDNEDIKLKSRIAMSMAKSMAKKLKIYVIKLDNSR